MPASPSDPAEIVTYTGVMRTKKETFHDEGWDDDEVADPVLAPPMSNRTPLCCVCFRDPRVLCILLGLVVIGVGVAVAVVYGTSTNDPLAPTPAPTRNPCPDQLQAMDDCFGDAVAENQCENCVVQFWPAKVDQCSDIDDETCSAFRECDCRTCRGQVQTYIECLSSCTLNCTTTNGVVDGSSNETLTPSVAPTPTPAPKCPDEYAAFNNCVDPINGGSQCEDCIVSQYWPPNPQQLGCSDIENATCVGLSTDGTCPCNGCDPELIAVLVCLSDCETWSCSSSRRQLKKQAHPQLQLPLDEERPALPTRRRELSQHESRSRTIMESPIAVALLGG